MVQELVSKNYFGIKGSQPYNSTGIVSDTKCASDIKSQFILLTLQCLQVSELHLLMYFMYAALDSIYYEVYIDA